MALEPIKTIYNKRVSRTKIQQPIANVNHPNTFFNLMPGILRESTLPKCTPTMAIDVMVSKNGQSIGRVSKSPKKPVSELSAIIKSEVPVAVFIGKPVSRTNAGMMRKPPPAPTKPVSSPIKVPSKTMSKVLYFFREGCISLRPRIMVKDANTIRTAKRPSKKSRFVTTNSPVVSITSGNAGTINLRVKKMVTMEGIPNRKPVLIFTKWSRYLGTAPAKLVVPTIKSE